MTLMNRDEDWEMSKETFNKQLKVGGVFDFLCFNFSQLALKVSFAQKSALIRFGFSLWN